MNCLLLPFKAKLIFYAKRGYFGEHGWFKIKWFTWLYHRREYVTRVRWIKRRKDGG